jgi:hypothetical protein
LFTYRSNQKIAFGLLCDSKRQYNRVGIAKLEKKTLEKNFEIAKRKRGFLFYHPWLIQMIRSWWEFIVRIPKKARKKCLAQLREEINLRDFMEAILLEFTIYGCAEWLNLFTARG